MCHISTMNSCKNILRERRTKERLSRSKEKAIETQNQISLSSDDEYEETNKPVIEIAAGVRIYESDLNSNFSRLAQC